MARQRKKQEIFKNQVVVYLRYSTANQKDLSIEYQRDVTDKYCLEHGYTIINRFIDKAKSGTNDKRPYFQKMIEEAQNEPPWSKIIVFKFNRFARNNDLDGYYRVILNQKKITVESATEDNSNTSTAKLNRNIIASYSAYMPENCAEHTHAALLTKAKKCEHCGGSPPLGYDIKDKKLTINKYEAETVRMIFDMYDKNYSYNDMIKVLNNEGRTTKKGSKFKKTSFNSILQQEKYKGMYIWNKSASKDVFGNYNSHEFKPVEEQVRIEGGCEAIIEPELFDRVQEKMKNNRNSNKRSGGNHHYMLGGMGKIYCSECNSLMVGASYKSHGKNYRYYACPNHKAKICATKNIRAQYIEKLVCMNITKIVLTKENICKYNALLQQISSSKPISGLNKELSGITTAINNILKTIEIYPTIEATERLASLSTKKAEIEKKILAINKTPKISESNFKMVRNEFAKTLKTSPEPLIYDILNYAINKITVNNDDVEIELNI